MNLWLSAQENIRFHGKDSSLIWKDSSKNLWRLINSGMSSNSKVSLGFEIQLNNEVLSYEEEINFSVFNCSKEDSVGKPLYSRFIKTNPHPLSGDYTPTPQEEIDESLYVYGKKGPQELEPNVSDDRFSEYSTCQSNDSAGSIGISSEHSVDPESKISSVPPEVYESTPITSIEKGVSDPKSKEVKPSYVSHIKTPRQPIKDQATPKVNKKNWNAMMERELGEGYSFTKKKCFVCGSLSHLIKDCDYYEKKMAKEVEVKKQRVCNTVQLKTGRPNINSVMPRVNTVTTNVNTVRSRQSIPTRTSNSNKDLIGGFLKNSIGICVTLEVSKGYISRILKKKLNQGTFPKIHKRGDLTDLNREEASSTGHLQKSIPKFQLLEREHLILVGLDPVDSPILPELEIFHKSETCIFDEASYDEEGVITDFNSLPTEIEVSPTPTLRIHNIHPKSQILGDPKSAMQTRSKHVFLCFRLLLAGIAWIYRRKAGVLRSLFFKQFWQTATANTIADGTLELHATIDTTGYTITEASIRDKLQLADASGITMLPKYLDC
ncbi:hypothetical protein Tco_0451631 [Tanacetum coccineum]